MLIKYTCQLLFLLFASFFSATAQKIPDSLKQKSFDFFEKKIQELENGNEGEKLQIYLNALLAKAKAGKDLNKMVKAYQGLAYATSGNMSLVYADSLLFTAQKINDTELIGSAYLTKAIVNYGTKNYTRSLDNFIIANDYLKNTNNLYLQHQVKYGIATIKFYLGFYDEALLLFQECTQYFKDSDIHGYLNSLHSTGLCYNKLGDYKKCSEINKLGLQVSSQLKSNDRHYFIHSEGVNQYFLKNYIEAIGLLKDAVPAIIKNEDFSTETIAYFYLGKSYTALGQIDEALQYFKKVDKIFSEKKYIRPDLRENYEILINYYKEQGDTKIQLHYINKLLKADKILNENFKYLSGKIHKEYDTKELLEAKNEIELELANKESVTIILYSAVAILFMAILIILYRYYTNQRIYRKKFEELMQKRKEPAIQSYNLPEELQENKKLDINPSVVAAILKQLEKFEKNKKYLQKDLTLVNLASTFNTNSNYLSKVISSSRNKNYITYINDLRIDYIVEQLKSEPRYRNYTIKALADEAGFNTAQHFSKAFFARTGIYPSYFVNELNKEYKEAG